MEQLETDRDKLREIKRSDATFAGKLHGLYVNRFGPVSYEDFRYAYLMIMRLNDNGRLTFPQISQAVQEAYDEFTSTRIGAGTDRNGAG